MRDDEETRSLIGRPSATVGSRVIHLEVRYFAIVTGALLGLYCGRHLVSIHSPPPLMPRDAMQPLDTRPEAAQLTDARPDAMQPLDARPEATQPRDARSPPKDTEPSWPEVRARIIQAQVQMESTARLTKALPRYAGPRVPGYLYVGPGHVLHDLSHAKQVPPAIACSHCLQPLPPAIASSHCLLSRDASPHPAPQPGNVTEVQCSKYCNANPACKGFAWCVRAAWHSTALITTTPHARYPACDSARQRQTLTTLDLAGKGHLHSCWCTPRSLSAQACHPPTIAGFVRPSGAAYPSATSRTPVHPAHCARCRAAGRQCRPRSVAAHLLWPPGAGSPGTRAARRTRDEPLGRSGPNVKGGLRCGRAGRPKSPKLRLSTRRLGAFSWESPRPCDSSARFQAQARADARDDAKRRTARG